MKHQQALAKAVEDDDMEALAALLNHRQRRFCEEYIIDFNGKAAAIRAGYSPTWADRQAHLHMLKPEIKAYIDHLGRKKVDSLVSVSPEWVIQKVVENIKTAEDIKNINAALRGLELMARHLGMLTDKTEITGKDGGAIELEQRVKEDASAFLNQLKQIAERHQAEKTDKKEVTLI